MESNNSIPQWVIEEAVTDCKDVQEFAHKYRRPERFTGQGEDYVTAIINNHVRDIEMKGYTCISSHDNITAKFITYVPDLKPQNSNL